MIIKRIDILIILLVGCQLEASTIAQQIQQVGYVEYCNTDHGSITFDALYEKFDSFIVFLQTNPKWAHTLYCAKERFIRSQSRNYYSTDFFGFYDESKNIARNQISFYYATHFDHFVCLYYPEMSQIPEIKNFFDACFEIQKSSEIIFQQVVQQLGLTSIFSVTDGRVPILFKVVKYLPLYVATRPHYDGTIFSLLLDSTDNNSLLLSEYKSNLTAGDFSTPVRIFKRESLESSMVLIPGALLTDCLIYPTPHIVVGSGKSRYAAIAFAMRPYFINKQNELSGLPLF